MVTGLQAGPWGAEQLFVSHVSGFKGSNMQTLSLSGKSPGDSVHERAGSLALLPACASAWAGAGPRAHDS